MQTSSKKTVYRKKRYERHGLTAGGQRPPAEYVIWQQMIQRCEDENCTAYPYYGGRGIKVCAAWRQSYLAFTLDMGPRPSPKHSLDRRETNGDYFPTNCRGATKKEQARNKRNNHLLTADGITLTLVEWCERLNCNRSAIHRRLAKGMSPQEALTVPFRVRRR